MNENSTLYWSALSTYEDCPQKFLWSYGWGDIDLGNGPGKSKTVPVKKSAHHALMGTVIQATLEKMYNEELYRDPKNLPQTLQQEVEKQWILHSQKPRNWIDFREAGMSEEEMVQVCRDGVHGYLKTMKAHKLLGTYAKSEVRLIGWINKWLSVGGIADFIIRREDTGITILDGKNSKHKMGGVDPDQLRWYAMVFKLAYRQSPDRLGFVWYRFPYGMEKLNSESDSIEIEQGVDWIPFTDEDLRGVARRAEEARDGMRKKKFAPTPSPKTCEYCDFLSVCEARQAQREANSRGPRGPKPKPEDFAEVPRTGGFVDMGVGE
jgi:CRISPR/Cas system-associated exonuclease Cas4 (RecB family)